MSAQHGADLWAAMAGADDVWAYLPAFPPKERAEYEALLDTMVKNKDICPFAVIDRRQGQGPYVDDGDPPGAGGVRGRLDHLFAVAPAHAAPRPRRCI